MGAFRDALLDSILDRDDLVLGHASAAEAFRPRVLRAVVVATRSRDHDEVLESARPLDRGRRLAHLHLLPRLGSHVSTHRTTRRAARELDLEGWELLAPVTKADLKARRALRAAIANAARLDAPRQQRKVEPARARIEPGGGGSLPSLDQIGEMTDAQIERLLRRFGRRPGREVMLSEAVERELRQLTRARRPDRALVDHATKRAMSAVRRELMLDAKAAVREVSLEAIGATATTRVRWVSVLDDDVCNSCNWRHGERKTMDEWDEVGLPGSDELVCDGQCRCELEEV